MLTMPLLALPTTTDVPHTAPPYEGSVTGGLRTAIALELDVCRQSSMSDDFLKHSPPYFLR